MSEETLKTWDGRIIGYIRTEPNGDQTGLTWRREIVGYYKREYNITTDFYGRRVSSGNTLSGLVMQGSDVK